MQKTAQKRNILDKIDEFADLSGRAVESVLGSDPEFKKLMDSLREKDNKIRSIASGETVEDADPGDDKTNIKDILKSANKNFNRREYMKCIAELSRFHKKLKDIVAEIESFNLDVDSAYHQFLYEDKEDDKSEEYRKHLRDLRTRFATNKKNELVKEAGITDFFHNLLSGRGRALKAFEDRYPKKVKELKSATSRLLSQSDSVLKNLLSTLKEMARSRSTRNIDAYVDGTKKIVKSYIGYNTTFKAYYDGVALDFLNRLDQFDKLTAPQQQQQQEAGPAADRVSPVAPSDLGELPPPPQETKVEMPAKPALEQQEVVTAPAAKVTPVAPLVTTPALTPEQKAAIEGKIPKATPSAQDAPPDKPPVLTPAQIDARRRAQLAQNPTGKKSHNNFLSSLLALSSESPELLALQIKKYANEIQSADPETSIKLLKIVKSIRG